MKKMSKPNTVIFLILLDAVLAVISLAFKQYDSAIVFVSILACYTLVNILMTLYSIESSVNMMTDILIRKLLADSKTRVEEISKMSDEVEKELQEVEVKLNKNKSKQKELKSELVSKTSSKATKRKPGRPRKTDK